MKFPYDGSFISPEMGALGIPSFDLTEADKKRALWQALMQGGIGMAAASLGGANTSQALGKGLLGGADAYGQALSAPLQRMELFGKQLKLQGDQLSNAKNLGELNDRKNMQGLFGSIGKINVNPFDAQQNIVDAGDGYKVDFGRGPMDNLVSTEQAQAAQFRNPAFLAQLMASGVKGSDLTALAGRFDPRSISANSWQQDPISGQSSYFGSLPQGMSVQNGRPAFMPGYQDEVQKADAAKAFNEQAIKAKFDDWVKQQEAAREVVTLPNKGTPETVLRSQLPQILGGGPAIGKNDPQPAAIYSNAEAAKLYASMPDGPEKQSLGRALMGGQQGNSGMGQGVNQITQNATQEGIKASIDAIGKSKDKAAESLNAALALQEATNAVKKGTYQGRFADWQTAGAALASAIPGLDKLVDPEKLANSQVASKHLAEQVLGRIKALGVNPSNADRDFIMKTIPMLTNDPAAFTRLTNYVQSMSLRAVDAHNAAADRLHATKGLSPDLIGMNYRIEVPQEIAQQRNAIKLLLQKGTPQERKQLRDMGYLD